MLQLSVKLQIVFSSSKVPIFWVTLAGASRLHCKTVASKLRAASGLACSSHPAEVPKTTDRAFLSLNRPRTEESQACPICNKQECY